MKFRKKPIVVDAVQWMGFENGPHNLEIVPYAPGTAQGWIQTLEGGHVVSPGDWIITGVKGEKYPCKPYIFAVTYEPVPGKD